MLISGKNTIFDLIYSISITFIPPLLILLFLNAKFVISDTVETNLYLLIFLNVIILIIISYYYRVQYKHLYNYSVDVGYLHFKPSVKDAMLGFYGNIFSVFILSFVFLFLFRGDNLESLSLSNFLIFSLLFSSLYHIISLAILIKSKNKLIATAMEPLESSLLERIKQIPGSNKIHEFRYADIKPASLFLTAGVTKYKGNKNICLVSRYFQWKLTEDDLYSVISHEIGHIQNRDLFIGYVILMFDFLLRTLYYTSILFALKVILLSSGYSLFEILLILNVFFVMVSSLFIRFILQYRLYNQEIKSDEYGGKVVGNYMMANTLKKMPSAIPAPVNDNPLEFLGFRIAILNERGKKLKEVLPSTSKTFSRFSNN